MSSELLSIGNSAKKEAPSGPRAKLYIRTFGCQMNEYDSQKLARILNQNYELTESAEDAELILVNTCSVREKPENKLYSVLGGYDKLKKNNPDLLIGVGGCVAQQEGERIVKRSKNVDFVFGTHNLSLVPSLVDARKSGLGPQVAIDYREDWEELPVGVDGGSRVSAYVSISRGCNKNCTYCIVPTTRGKEVSRDPKEIEKEVRIAVHRGAREIVLLGQTVNSYGLDLSPRMKFVELLELVANVDGVERIRFTSPHPQEVRPDFYELVATNPKVCRHIHMPLQSGSNRILKLMNRNYKKERYIKIIDGLRDRVPDIAITTDIIVGFPGETDDEFNETLEMMDYVEFDGSYSFIFSARPGTVAAEMEDNTSHAEKLDRLQLLQKRQEVLTESRLTAWLGKEAEILIDGPSYSDPKRLCGRISQNFTVNLVEHPESLEPGSFVMAKITDKARHTLKGEVTEVL